MNSKFNHFHQSLINPTSVISEGQFFRQGEEFLNEQLQHYLKNHGIVVNSFNQAIEAAQKLNNIDTHKKFWRALTVINNCIKSHQKQSNIKLLKRTKRLKFVNIIEQLQDYSGSQLFAGKQIKLKQKHRLYFAYLLTWEHLRYLAGQDDEFSPSREFLEQFSMTFEHDH